MTTELKLPNLGENIHAGNVVRVLVSEGDVITEQQPILEIETDKAAIEVPSPEAGKVVGILVKEGDTVEVGAPIISLEPQEGKAAAAREKEPSAKEAAPVRGEEQQPRGKAAPEPGKAETPEQERRKRIAQPSPSSAPSRPSAPQTPPASAPARKEDVDEEGGAVLVPAAPSVRRFAREIAVDITAVTGSGPGGRISMDDVKTYAKTERSAPQAAAQGVAPAVQLPDFNRWGETRREPFSNVRRATARQMAAAWSTIPHVTQFDKADVTDLEAMRKRYAAKAEEAGGKLTVTAIIVKVVASALKVFPKFNASLDMAKGEIVFKSYFNVGVAVDTERGLLVPVIRDVDQKNIIEISADLAALSEKARAGKLTPDEMQGGSFTVSNLGGIGGTAFAPIVNLPEVAILGVARASMEPVFRDDGFEPRLVLPLSLSYDHRLIDGADGARFLRWVAEALEQPFLLSLEG